MMDSFLTNMQLMDWSGVNYLWIIVMFLSAVWTLILTAPIHCIGEKVMLVMLNFSKSVPMKKLISILDDLRVSTFS